MARLGGLKLVPGHAGRELHADGERTVLCYLTKPLTDQVLKAFRER